MENQKKYQPGFYNPPECTYDWVKKDHIEKAPYWCSVDLRDGNQALIVPMSLEEKLAFFKVLVDIGFKEIEVGFPAASETEFEFLRTLIEKDMIPDDVTVQVLTQSRAHIIDKTFAALEGAKSAVVHLYNSTSVAQREQVFRKSKEQIKQIAIDGATLMNEYAAKYPGTNFIFEYSPESFTGTEPEYALEVSNAVIDIWNPTPEHPMILNLPATVEMSSPHVYANQVEYMHKNIHNRDGVRISLHPHNDRGTGVADAELGLLAGADRIEGTLFGNGERTGNADIITIAMNMYTHGVETGLDFSNMPEIVDAYEEFTRMTVGPRQPYAGELVFAAFSGSHQDAISKGMNWRKEKDLYQWTVPYLPIDPHDVGRRYDGDVIRINSQSGKGGVAYILEQNFGLDLPKDMRAEVGYMMKDISDKHHEELSPQEIMDYFSEEYINDFTPLDITDATFNHYSSTKEENLYNVKMRVVIHDEVFHLDGEGNGRLDAVRDALTKTKYDIKYDFITYSENAMTVGSNSKAASYVCIADEEGKKYWGVGTQPDIILATVNALVSAINRMNKVKKFM
ncbi:MAG: 2-isopropylmalate synthase [Eubacteriales bacterium]|nr:2-isopropylmalate synthase [Eubacteriales bacterium]